MTKYAFHVYEVDTVNKKFVRFVNAFSSEKRAISACERLNAEASLYRTGKEYDYTDER